MRLIDADELKEVVRREMQEPWAKGMGDAICKLLDAAPEYKIAPLIHCKDCKYCHEKHYENEGEPPYIKRRCTNKYAMKNSGYAVFADCYCAFGDRKEETKNETD